MLSSNFLLLLLNFPGLWLPKSFPKHILLLLRLHYGFGSMFGASFTDLPRQNKNFSVFFEETLPKNTNFKLIYWFQSPGTQMVQSQSILKVGNSKRLGFVICKFLFSEKGLQLEGECRSLGFTWNVNSMNGNFYGFMWKSCNFQLEFLRNW